MVSLPALKPYRTYTLHSPWNSSSTCGSLSARDQHACALSRCEMKLHTSCSVFSCTTRRRVLLQAAAATTKRRRKRKSTPLLPRHRRRSAVAAAGVSCDVGVGRPPRRHRLPPLLCWQRRELVSDCIVIGVRRWRTSCVEIEVRALFAQHIPFTVKNTFPNFLHNTFFGRCPVPTLGGLS